MFPHDWLDEEKKKEKKLGGGGVGGRGVLMKTEQNREARQAASP